MPNLVTHYLMAKGVEQELPPSLQRLIQQQPKDFVLGTMGPDIFFYYHIFPWNNAQKAERIHDIGNQIHEQHINHFFAAFLSQVKKQQSQPAVISYALGFLCHFALDLTAHPYIYARTQTREQPDDLYEHRALESHIDGIFIQALQRTHQLSPSFKAYSLVHFSKAQAQLLAELYQPVLAKVCHQSCSLAEFQTMLKDCYIVQRLLYDPNNWKRELAKTIERHFHCQLDALSIMIPIHQWDAADILNLKHMPWQHPVTGEWQTDSMIDLFSQSIEKAKHLIQLFVAYLKDEQPLTTVLAAIQHRSFDTGINWRQEMHYFKDDR